MNFRNWLSLWRFDREVDIPHLSINLMCPWFFVRVLWYHCTKEFKAWPSQYETGIVIGVRWPFGKRFREKAWLKKEDMPLALYRAMDLSYMARAARDLRWGNAERPYAPYIPAVVRAMGRHNHRCAHDYWIANCPDCARRSLTLAVMLMSQVKTHSVPDPNEDPLTAFRRREAEAKRLEDERNQKCLE